MALLHLFPLHYIIMTITDFCDISSSQCLDYIIYIIRHFGFQNSFLSVIGCGTKLSKSISILPLLQHYQWVPILLNLFETLCPWRHQNWCLHAMSKKEKLKITPFLLSGLNVKGLSQLAHKGAAHWVQNTWNEVRV